MTFKQYAEKQRKAIKMSGRTPVKAILDAGGNCIYCGEAGRCPGYHVGPAVTQKRHV